MSDASPELTVRDNPESDSYDALIEDKVVGSIVYQRGHDLAGPRIIFRSTVVDPQMRGHGIGSKLVKAALDDVRAQGATLTSYCSFVDEYIADHQEYADLVDRTHPGQSHRG